MKPLQRVFVSGVASGQNPSPGVGVARCLRAAFPQATLVAVDYSRQSAGLAWQDFDEAVVRPPWTRGRESRHAEYVRRCVAAGGIWISCLDLELALLAKRLPGRGNVPCPPSSALRLAAKPAAAVGRLLGLPVPPSFHLGDAPPRAVASFCREHGWPVWVKGPQYGAAPAWSWYELEPLVRRMAAHWGGRRGLLLQAHSEGQDVTIAFAALRGELLGAVQLEKLERTAEGKVWSGRVSPVPVPLERRLRALARATRWTGGGEIECVRDPLSRLWLIECNPRFPAWIYGAALAGQNLPARLVAAISGRPSAAPRLRRRGFTRVVLESPAPL